MLLDFFQALCARNTAQLKTKPANTTLWKALSGHYTLNFMLPLSAAQPLFKLREELRLIYQFVSFMFTFTYLMGMSLCCWVKRGTIFHESHQKTQDTVVQATSSVASNTLGNPRKVTPSHVSLAWTGYTSTIKIRLKNIFQH